MIREGYEHKPLVPAIFNATVRAISLSALTGMLLTVIMILVPFAAWSQDEATIVFAPVVIADILKDAYFNLPKFVVYNDIADEVTFREAGIILGSVLAALLGFVVGWEATPFADRRVHYSGRRLITGKAARAGAAWELLAKTTGKREPLTTELAPGVPWPRAWKVLNLLILGAIGSGKTRLLLGLIEGMLARATDLTVDFGMLVYDATGEILTGLPVADDRIAVISATRDAGFGWAMSEDIRYISDCETVATQRATSNREQGFWVKAPATLDAGAMVLAGIEHKSWSAPELYNISLRDPVKLKEAWLIHYPPAAELIRIDPATGDILPTSSNILISWRANTLKTLRPLAEAWKSIPKTRMFSFSGWLEGSQKQPKIVVIERSGRSPDISSGWMSMAMDAIASHVGDPNFTVSQTRLRCFIIDEAPTLVRLERWSEILDTGRNKGLSTVAVCQDIQQFRTTYGESSKSIFQRFRLKIVCEQTPGPDAEEISDKWIGKRKVQDWRTAPTVDGKVQTPKPEEVPIMPAEHLSDRLGVSGSKVTALILGLKQIYKLEWPITVWKRRR